MRLINFNGSIHSENIPVAHAWNRSFRYGDGLFETMAIRKTVLPFLSAHWQRMAQGMQLLGLEAPPHFTETFLEKSILELAALNGISSNACARIMLYREGRGRYAPDAMQAGFVIETEPLQGELFALNDTGWSIGLFPNMYKSVDRLSNFKTNSALAYVLASIYKTKSGWNDCLILNARAHVCDSTNSNVFLVKGKTVTTPALSEGCISGVMRGQVISIARNNGFTVNETAVETEALREADEIFLTNAVNGIRWVQRYGNGIYGNGCASMLSALLRKQVDALVHGKR